MTSFNTTTVTVTQEVEIPGSRRAQGTTNQITLTDGGAQGDLVWALASNTVMPGTAGLILPTGTTAQQGSTNGGARYNSDNTEVEFRENGTWRPKQNKDATLTALAAFNTDGFILQTAADTFTAKAASGASQYLRRNAANTDYEFGTLPGVTWTISSSHTSGFTASFGTIELCDLSSSAFTVTLPSAASHSGEAIRIFVTNVGNQLTIQSTSSQTIRDGVTTSFTTTSVAVGDMWEFVSNGSNWI